MEYGLLSDIWYSTDGSMYGSTNDPSSLVGVSLIGSVYPTI